MSVDRPDPPPGAAREPDENWRARWESTQSSLRQRFDEPIEHATALTRRTMAWFPVRVWRHFLRSNGFLLAASISYQSLFAMFAVVYVAFAIAGVWLGGSTEAVQAVISVVNSYIPDLISDTGPISPKEVTDVAQSSTGALAVTGAAAFLVAVWTAIGFVTFTRRAVRDIFGLPFDGRGYVLLKARDFVAAVLFGIALLLGAGLGAVASGAVDLLFHLLGWADSSEWLYVLGRVLSILVAFAINSTALALLFRFLAGAAAPWPTIWPGALLGGAAIGVLQISAGLLLVYTPSNPLLATFSVFIAFLVWFRLIAIVILVAASWIAVVAADRDIPLGPASEHERRVAEAHALVVGAEQRLRAALAERERARWWQVWRAWRAEREVREAEQALDDAQAGLTAARAGGRRLG
ncbi:MULTISPECIES: YihY/virulence factor BrkB family protein [unclassified Microbacterium]|uniref:YihY/virulence factor BrkB family protein n=1 Tax=unclassified Microbacterium TaxID=2609290 RepID=UPI00214CF55C|nr:MULTISPECIES: YihY/virulence factor BrkB family protein [unclassified Microbacterium]MCR2785158.1 YihY/virulence factor BrkB family protein [Microbacterium sp. zg.B96]MDL5352520.1 YihY/virulence factor BrkB family protein [Microbacterium sp. zg-YB36]WIM16691.1 YihY/virulence factor BrkB family protein [Microbacterium sp. zg-B96]